MSAMVQESKMKKLIASGSRPKKFEKKKAAASEKITPTSPKKGKAGTKWDGEGHKGNLDYGAKSEPRSDSESQPLNNDLAKYASKSDVGKYKGDLQSIEVESSEVQKKGFQKKGSSILNFLKSAQSLDLS